MMYDLVITNACVIADVGIGNCNFHAEKLIDASGYTALPGLTDCHVHVLNAVITLLGVELQQCTGFLDNLSKRTEILT